MSWTSHNSKSGVIYRNILRIVNSVIRGVECVYNKRFYINIILFLLSVGLISGFYFSINDEKFWENTYNTVYKETTDKVKLMGITFVAKTQNKLDASVQLVYSNSKNAINKKSFHKLPKLHIRSKTSIFEIFTNKSFNTIDDSKKLRLGELKWKLFSKIQ